MFVLAIGHILWRLFQLLIFLLLVVFVLLVTQQRKLLYRPVIPGSGRRNEHNQPQRLRDPVYFGIPSQEVYVASGVRIFSWLLSQERRADAYTWLYFHGNAGNIGMRLDTMSAVYRKLGVNIMAMEYRSFGNSDDGKISESNFIEDALAVYRWLVTESGVDPRRVVLFGRSLGGAVAIALAHRIQQEAAKQEPSPMASQRRVLPLPVAMILENTFLSIPRMATHIFPPLKPFGPLLPPLVFDAWDSATRLKEIGVHALHDNSCAIPILFLSGSLDTLVPPLHMLTLHSIIQPIYRQAQFPDYYAQLQCLPLGGHNDTPYAGGELYWKALREFHSRIPERSS